MVRVHPGEVAVEVAAGAVAGVVAGAGPEAEQAEGGGVARRLGLISLCQRGRGTSPQTLPSTCRVIQRCYTRRWSRESGRVL